MQTNIRNATPDDIQVIYDMIYELAVYEKLEDQVKLTTEDLYNVIFNEKIAHVLIAQLDENIVGYCLYFYNVSTFKGRKGIYVEDVYVRPEFRKNGLGKALLCKIRDIAIDNNCGRIEWSCLDWNVTSADFYVSMGAQKNDGWDLFRVDEAHFDSFGKQK